MTAESEPDKLKTLVFFFPCHTDYKSEVHHHIATNLEKEKKNSNLVKTSNVKASEMAQWVKVLTQ